MSALPPSGEWDLHTHSVYSDGTTTPTEIARLASASGLSGFALTDHDTIAGWEEARQAAADEGIGFVPGIELTTDHRGSSRHLLAYRVQPGQGELFAAIDEVREARRTRAQEMVRRLQRDYDISWDELQQEHSERGEVVSIGRPHIADSLVARGYASDRTDAFTRILHTRSPYYLDTLSLETALAIRLVREAGGVAVLAHPAAHRMRRPVSAEELALLAQAGLVGVELAHPENRPDWTAPLHEAARELGLSITGSSDFHGAGKPNRLGECTTPEGTVRQLLGM